MQNIAVTSILKNTMIIRNYSDLRRLETFEERFDYLNLYGLVGEATFGYERYLNQRFYTSREWRSVRRDVIARDYGCDLGIRDRPIHERIYIHHMNPMRPDDLLNFNDDVLNPEFLISVSHNTHNAIHYGNSENLLIPSEPRKPGDTKLW